MDEAYLMEGRRSLWSAHTRKQGMHTVIKSSVTFLPPLPHRDAVYLEEGQSCGRRVGVETVLQLVQVVGRLRLHLDHLCARGDVLTKRSLVTSGEEGHGLIQLIK